MHATRYTQPTTHKLKLATCITNLCSRLVYYCCFNNLIVIMQDVFGLLVLKFVDKSSCRSSLTTCCKVIDSTDLLYKLLKKTCYNCIMSCMFVYNMFQSIAYKARHSRMFVPQRLKLTDLKTLLSHASYVLYIYTYKRSRLLLNIAYILYRF